VVACKVISDRQIHAEFKRKTDFIDESVNNLLKFANGLDNKMRRLLLPAIVGMRIAKFTGLQKLAEDISSVRSRIVHQGEFLDEEASVIVIEKARMFIQQLVTIYDQNFQLKDKSNYTPPSPAKKAKKKRN